VINERLFHDWYGFQYDLELAAVRYHNEKNDMELKERYEKEIFYLNYKLWITASTVKKTLLQQVIKDPILDGFYQIDLPMQSEDRYLKVRTILDRFLRARIAGFGSRVSLGFEYAYSEPVITLRIFSRRTCEASMEIARRLHIQTMALASDLGARPVTVNTAFKAAHPRRPVKFGSAMAMESFVDEPLSKTA
jgi:hypothetical protein